MSQPGSRVAGAHIEPMTEPREAPAAPGRSVASRRAAAAPVLRRAAPFVGGAVAALVVMSLYGALVPSQPPLTGGDVDQRIDDKLASMTPAPPFSRGVYASILPSFVIVQASGKPGAEADGVGSGVVVSDRGDILTSLHVVAGATGLLVTFTDGRSAPAEIVAERPDDDIAVLRSSVPPMTLIPAVLGNPNALRIGDEAYLVGNPFGLAGSMSSGVISGLDRSFEMEEIDRTLEGLIQVDAAVNPGNSGGPLLDRSGRVVGIVAALLNPTDERVFVGVGLAVPIDVAGGAADLPPY